MEQLINRLKRKPFKIFYNGLVPRGFRHKWEFFYQNLPAQKRVANYWHNVIEEYLAGNIEKYTIQPKKDLGNKKIIWQYWGQGLDGLPEIIQLSFASVDKFKGDYEVIRITNDNLDEYLDFPNFVKEKKENNPAFKPAFFSDLLRMALINTYGGIWLDATILLTDTIPNKYEQYDLFMFSRDPNSKNKYLGDKPDMFFCWDANYNVKHLNSIIYGHKNTEISSVVLDLLLYFWKTENEIPHYFFFQIMLNKLQTMQAISYDNIIEDDTLPHLLQRLLNDKFDETHYKEIIHQTSLHKLTLHKKLKTKRLNGDLTYFGYLKNFSNTLKN